MSEIQIKQGNTIYEKGNALTIISIIMEGSVSVSLPNGSLKLVQGDVIGILDLYTALHSYTYAASSDVVVDSYPYKSIDSLQAIMSEDSSYCEFFARSAFKQFFAVADFYQRSTGLCDSLYSTLMEYYRDYAKLCKQYRIPNKNLPGLEYIQPLILESKPDEYITAYYKDLLKMCEEIPLQTLFGKSGFLSGFLLQISRDMHQYLSACEDMEEYQSHLATLLINDDKIDFLDLYISLLTQASHNGEDTVYLRGAITKMFLRSKNMPCISEQLYQSRYSEYHTLTTLLETASSLAADAAAREETKKIAEKKLFGSLSRLLEYSSMDKEFCETFTDNVEAYKKIVDKTSVSSEFSALRNELTHGFFELYKNIFFISAEDSNLPEIVKMFLCFGYVDEDLCGLENAVHLYELLPSYRSDENKQIYLFYDWMKLIYSGKKQPRRDEFDQDYPAYIQSLINDGKIAKSQAPQYLNDNRRKAEFELDNMFMTAVKMTYGRLQTYCPLLSEHDFIKTPAESLLRPSALKQAFDEIMEIDFSAFHREYMLSDPGLPNGREIIRREILPDIILLPNIGIRAALWQEIEGRNRSTPACMLFPVFCLADIKQLALRLTGEFRWEMCKRVQGSRWNDVSNLSLTSEYFDYLQFYKKNKELSPEAKEKCRMQLARVKNRFRESFILDYIAWITYEAKGAPHLNKITRKIFMTYCPVSAPYREELKKNPFYTSLLEKYDNQKMKDLTRINSIIYRIRRNGKTVPAELTRMAEFLEK